MKKLTLLVTGIALLTLTSCSKEPLTSQADCDKALQEYQKEMKELLNTNQFTQDKIDIIDQKYLKKYPNCKFY
jgi:outer membrane biogenesis lipoprotein LolB